jgi:hypothetical protein
MERDDRYQITSNTGECAPKRGTTASIVAASIALATSTRRGRCGGCCGKFPTGCNVVRSAALSIPDQLCGSRVAIALTFPVATENFVPETLAPSTCSLLLTKEYDES